MGEINLIFDLDGTLVDSYDAITEWFHRVLIHFGLDFSPEYLRELFLKHNADYAIRQFSEKYNLVPEEIYAFSDTVVQKIELIKPYPNVLDVVDNLKYNSYIYTHRGKTTKQVLQLTGLENKFIDIVTSLDNFPRKPSPDALIFLMSKHKMNKEKTYYVGDRLIDIKSGINAGIKTIFVNSSKLDIDASIATYVVEKIDDINLLNL